MTLPVTMQPPNGFVFEQPPGRPFRTMSIETEVDGQGVTLALNLCASSIINEGRVQSYGYKPTPTSPCIAYLKYDGSVTGGELVFDKIDLTLKSHAKALLRAHEILRECEKEGQIAYNPNCGGHSHVDAHGYGFFDVLRLGSVFGFLEEPIYRLAGAGKTYGHRTLYAGYDRANMGHGYANPIKKGPFVTPQVALKEIQTQGRMSGLNFTIFMENLMYYGCSGGCPGRIAIYERAKPKPRPRSRVREGGIPQAGILRVIPRDPNAPPEFVLPDRDWIPVDPQEPPQDWIPDEEEPDGSYTTWDIKNCTCNNGPLPKHTIEWRVWNSQGNPRIIYGWVALMQALHAYAWRPGDDASYKEQEPMPAMAWESKPFSKITQANRRVIQDRVAFMFSELPLTAQEKDALRYSYMKTPYKVFGKDWFKRQADTPYKEPPFMNVYTKPFKTRTVVCKEGV